MKTSHPATTMKHVLALIPQGCTGVVVGLRMDPEEAAWLRALGVGEGQRVRVLRRAALGGPLHVRIACGGEFAIDRSLARSIDVEVDVAEAAE